MHCHPVDGLQVSRSGRVGCRSSVPSSTFKVIPSRIVAALILVYGGLRPPQCIDIAPDRTVIFHNIYYANDGLTHPERRGYEKMSARRLPPRVSMGTLVKLRLCRPACRTWDRPSRRTRPSAAAAACCIRLFPIRTRPGRDCGPLERRLQAGSHGERAPTLLGPGSPQSPLPSGDGDNFIRGERKYLPIG